MPTFELTHEEAQLLMNRLINSDPLLMKIAAQLREQTPATQVQAMSEDQYQKVKRSADGKEARHE